MRSEKTFIETKPRKTISVLYDMFYPYRWHLFVLFFLGLFSGLLAGFGVSAVIPLFAVLAGQKPSTNNKSINYILNAFERFQILHNPTYLILFILSLFVIRAIVLFLFLYLRSRLRHKFQHQSMSELLEKILQAKWPFLLQQRIGYLQNLVTHDVNKSADLFEYAGQILLYFTTALIFSIFAVIISPRLILLAVLIGLVTTVLFRPLTKKMRSWGEELSNYERQTSNFITEHLTGLKTIKSSATEIQTLKKGVRYFHLLRTTDIKKSVVKSMNKILIEPLTIVFVSLAFLFSYRTPGFSFGVFAAGLFLLQRIFLYIEGFQSGTHAINELIPYAEHMLEYKEKISEQGEVKKDGYPFQLKSSLDFKKVSFGYVPEKEILSDLSFKLLKGETLGLIGPSGVGKTSIADLLMRLFEPQKGQIMLDGTEDFEYELKDWRNNIGYVSQDIFLLNDTIENNIKFYRQDINDEAVIEAAQKTNIYEFIQGLKDGLATVVGDRGVMLSGGQRQRIVLARVLARNPAVLILDEATSSLDNESEVLIQDAIQNLRGKTTILIIAHRLSTVMNVDRLLVLDHGRIMEEGKPHDLLTDTTSYFHKMHHLKELP